jgi:hypothetical protein
VSLRCALPLTRQCAATKGHPDEARPCDTKNLLGSTLLLQVRQLYVRKKPLRLTLFLRISPDLVTLEEGLMIEVLTPSVR